MYFKHLDEVDVSHVRYPILKTRTLVNGSQDYQLFVQTKSNPTEYQLAGLKRFIQSNYHIQSYDSSSGVYHSIEGNIFPQELFTQSLNTLQLNTSSVQNITYFKYLYGIDTFALSQVTTDTSGSLSISSSIIKNTSNEVQGYFLQDINAILWNIPLASDTSVLQVQYNFFVHEFEYYCSINPGEMNMTNNPTAYSTGSTRSILPHVVNTYISSIGLYDTNDTLLAIAKLSTPIKVSTKISTTVIINLDYIP